MLHLMAFLWITENNNLTKGNTVAENTTQREIDNLRKLIWTIAWALFLVGGSCFGLLWGANTGQDTRLEQSITRDVMIEYKTDNQREHDAITRSMEKIDDTVGGIRDDVSEMKGMLIELTK